jgi:hypothetical protein
MLCCLFVSWKYAKRRLLCFIEDAPNLLKSGRHLKETRMRGMNGQTNVILDPVLLVFLRGSRPEKTVEPLM